MKGKVMLEFPLGPGWLDTLILRLRVGSVRGRRQQEWCGKGSRVSAYISPLAALPLRLKAKVLIMTHKCLCTDTPVTPLLSADFSFVHFVLTTLTPNCSLKVPDSCAGPLHWLFLLLGMPSLLPLSQLIPSPSRFAQSSFSQRSLRDLFI